MTKIQSPEPLSSASERLHPTIPRVKSNRVKSPMTASEIRQRQLDREEMQSLLAKLKQLVPGIPKNRKLSKLEIIQHVIDYIFDLQMALESHPISAGASVSAADFVSSTFSALTTSMADNEEYLSLNTGYTGDSLYDSCDHHHHHHHQQQAHHNNHHHYNCQPNHCSTAVGSMPVVQSQQQRIPSSHRQPLASIVL